MWPQTPSGTWENQIQITYPGTWVEPLHSWWAWCASSLVPRQVFTTSVLYFLPHGMSTELINSLCFLFREEQRDAPLARQPSRTAPLAPPADTAHAHETCPAQNVCVRAHSLLFLQHNSSEPSRRSHQDISAMGVRHFWTLISLTTKSN